MSLCEFPIKQIILLSCTVLKLNNFSVFLVMWWTYKNFSNNETWGVKVMEGKTNHKNTFFTDSSNFMKCQPPGIYIWAINEGNIFILLKSLVKVFCSQQSCNSSNQIQFLPSDWHNFPLITYIELYDLVVVFMLI